MKNGGWSPKEFAWNTLLAGLREGDAVSVLQFHHRIVPNVEWLLRRYGAVHPRRLAGTLCHEAVLRIQAGSLISETDLARHLREQIARAVPAEHHESYPLTPDLGKCPSRESELAIRYYALGQDGEEICRTMHLTPEAFHNLRMSARELFRRSLSGKNPEDGINPLVYVS